MIFYNSHPKVSAGIIIAYSLYTTTKGTGTAYPSGAPEFTPGF